MFVFRTLAHSLAFNVGDLGYIHSVAGSGLHYDVECGHFGVVCYICADTESHFGLALEVTVDLGGAGKVQTVAEKKRLCKRIDIETLLMLYHTLAPGDRVAAVMAHSAEQGRIGKLKVLKETFGSDGIG